MKFLFDLKKILCISTCCLPKKMSKESRDNLREKIKKEMKEEIEQVPSRIELTIEF